MNKDNITLEVLDNKTLISKFKNKSKYLFDTKYLVYQNKSTDINENYRLDCGEFDDNIAKYQARVEKFHNNVINDIKNFDAVNGINYNLNKLEEEKKDRIKNFVDGLNDLKNEINHIISNEEKEFELSLKEKNDLLISKEKDSKAKLNEAKKKLNVEIAKEEQSRLKKCDVIEKGLLLTNDRDEIKNLILNQKEIRQASLNNIFQIKTKYYNDVHEMKVAQLSEKFDSTLELAKFKNDALKIKNKHRRDIDELIEKIKAREDYYLQTISQESVDYFNDLIIQVEQKRKKANDDGYLVEKDVLNLRLKQIKFIEKELSVVYKNQLNVVATQIDEYYENVKVLLDILKKYFNYFEPKFKLGEEDPKNQKELLNLISSIKNAISNSNQELIAKLAFINEEKIKYIDFSLEPLKDEVLKIGEEHLVRTNDIYNELINNKTKDNFNEIYRDKIKELHSHFINFSKEIKSCFKEFSLKAKEYVQQLCKEKSFNLNNDTVSTDDRFTNMKIVDEANYNMIVESYQKHIEVLQKTIETQNLILSKIGVVPSKTLEEKNLKIDKEYEMLVSTNKKSLSENLKIVGKEYKDALSKSEENLKEMISRL